jgi:hypothetical protein
MQCEVGFGLAAWALYGLASKLQTFEPHYSTSALPLPQGGVRVSWNSWEHGLKLAALSLASWTLGCIVIKSMAPTCYNQGLNHCAAAVLASTSTLLIRNVRVYSVALLWLLLCHGPCCPRPIR